MHPKGRTRKFNQEIQCPDCLGDGYHPCHKCNDGCVDCGYSMSVDCGHCGGRGKIVSKGKRYKPYVVEEAID